MNFRITLLILIGITFTSIVFADEKWTDKTSDPRSLGWMQGFPPSVEKRITQPESNFFAFPKLRWSVCHIRELMPTARVFRGLGVNSELKLDLIDGIDDVTFFPIDAEEPMSWHQSLEANFTDGLLIIHEGKLVYEYYSGCLSREQKHAAMSMTKSLTGLLAEIMISEGLLDESLRVDQVIPELAQSGFADSTVRQVMDMTTSLVFSENYADPKADIWRYSQAASPLPKEDSYQGPNGYFEFLQTVEKDSKHGEIFGYKTVNSDALGWIISRVSGQPVNELFSKYLWQPLGMEQDAYMTVDALGTPFAGGGLSASLRDLGRVGLLMLNEGVWQGTQIIPRDVVTNISSGGDRNAFAQAGFPLLSNASYRSMWWIFHNSHGAYAARGVHGQTIYIDPKANMVIVRFASFPDASNSYIDPTSLPAFQAVAEYLMSVSR